jgi:hypothetical protein
MIAGSHSGGYEEAYLRGITPCSPLKVNGRFSGTSGTCSRSSYKPGKKIFFFTVSFMEITF